MSLENVPNFVLNFSEAEMNRDERHLYRFKTFQLDIDERQLLQNDVPVPLTPKAFDVLAFLVERSAHLVEKEELMRSVWPDSFVEEANVARIIHTLRNALGEGDNGNKFIETVAKKGYRFIAKVNVVREPAVQNPTNGKPEISSANGFQIPPLATDKSVISHLDTSRRRTWAILLTVGFLILVSLFVLLSFNFRSVSPNKPNGARSSNDEAYRLYLLGSALADKQNPKDAQKALEAFDQAVTLDPNYAPAYARMANVHSEVAFMGGGGNATEEYLKAKTALEKALAIDDNLAEAHSYLGEIRTNFEWDFDGAERDHKRAVELNPNSAPVRQLYSLLLAFLGRSDESIAEIKTAIDLEPASALYHKTYLQNLFYAGHYDESIAEGKRTIEMDPEFLGVYDTLIGSYIMKGEDDQAFEWFQRQQEQKGVKPDEVETWKTIYAQSGWFGIYKRQLEQAKEAEKNGNGKPMLLARLCTKTGNFEEAFVYLEKAFIRREQGMISLKVSPNYDPLRSDPRFDALLKRIGLK